MSALPPEAIIIRFAPMGEHRIDDRLLPDAIDALEEDGRFALSVYGGLKPADQEFDVFLKDLIAEIPINGTKYYWPTTVERLEAAGMTLYKCPPDPYHYDVVLGIAPERDAVVRFVEAFDEKRKAPK